MIECKRFCARDVGVSRSGTVRLFLIRWSITYGKMKPGCEQLIKKSSQNFDTALSLIESDRCNAAANRLYYSLFQVAKACAVSHGKMVMAGGTDVHRTARGFVKELLKSEGPLYDTFEEALELRKKADYDPEDVTVNDLTTAFRNEAQSLRDRLEKLAKSA